MNLHELILARRTVHSYLPDPVPMPILEKAVECAAHAMNHRLTFPWRFYHVGPEALVKIADLHDEMKRKKFLAGGEVFVLGLVRPSKPDLKPEAKAQIEDEDYASLGCAVENMALYLWSEGFGTKWSTGAVSMHPSLHEILGTSASALRLCGFLRVGRPEAVPDKPARPELERFLIHLP